MTPDDDPCGSPIPIGRQGSCHVRRFQGAMSPVRRSPVGRDWQASSWAVLFVEPGWGGLIDDGRLGGHWLDAAHH